MPSSEIRALKVTDLDRVLELEGALFAPDDWSAAVYREEITHPARVYLACEVDGVLIAWGGVYCAESAEILTIGVAPTHQRRGHGGRMLEALLEAARARSAREVFLEVRADDAGAQELYRKHGFQEIGRRARYYPVSGADAVVMQREL